MSLSQVKYQVKLQVKSFHLLEPNSSATARRRPCQVTVQSNLLTQQNEEMNLVTKQETKTKHNKELKKNQLIIIHYGGEL